MSRYISAFLVGMEQVNSIPAFSALEARTIRSNGSVQISPSQQFLDGYAIGLHHRSVSDPMKRGIRIARDAHVRSMPHVAASFPIHDDHEVVVLHFSGCQSGPPRTPYEWMSKNPLPEERRKIATDLGIRFGEDMVALARSGFILSSAFDDVSTWRIAPDVPALIIPEWRTVERITESRKEGLDEMIRSTVHNFLLSVGCKP